MRTRIGSKIKTKVNFRFTILIEINRGKIFRAESGGIVRGNVVRENMFGHMIGNRISGR